MRDLRGQTIARPAPGRQEDDMAEPRDMWRCQMGNCGYVYDPDRGDKRHKIPAGTKFEDLPDDWQCPVCGASKKTFKCMADEG